MADLRKQKLIDLGADALADAFLNLAMHSDEADDLTKQLIATPKENVRQFKKKLSSLKRRKRFIGWRESVAFSRKLKMLLQELKSGVDDPLIGLELVVAFYEADKAVFEMCDDSSSSIGDVLAEAMEAENSHLVTSLITVACLSPFWNVGTPKHTPMVSAI